jgi:hypothetical protein
VFPVSVSVGDEFNGLFNPDNLCKGLEFRLYLVYNYFRPGGRHLTFPESTYVGSCRLAINNVSASEAQSGCGLFLPYQVLLSASAVCCICQSNCYFYALTQIITQSRDRKRSFVELEKMVCYFWRSYMPDSGDLRGQIRPTLSVRMTRIPCASEC